MQRLNVRTRSKRQVVDITDHINNFLSRSHQGQTGLCNAFVLHTTAAITTADLDPGTDLDMLAAFDAIVPKLNYRHPHDPEHTPDHILSAMIGTSVLLPVHDGGLVLGTWQRVILMDFDGPREREIALTFIPAP